MQPETPTTPPQPTTPTHTETTREREVIVTGNDRSNSNAIIAIVAVLAFALLAWLAVNNLSSGDVIPDDVNINIEDSGGTSADTSGESDPAPAAETDATAEEPAPAEETAP